MIGFVTMILVVAFFAGCGGGRVTPPNPDNKDLNGIKVVEKTIHHGANGSFYPIDVWGDPMSGRDWTLYADENNAKALSTNFLNGQYVHTENSTDWLIDTEWHVTSGLWLSATNTMPVGSQYNYALKAQERFWDGTGYNTPGDTTQIALSIKVVADDYTYPTTDPVNGGSITCGEGAVLINTSLRGWSYYGFYRVEDDNTKTYLPARIATTESATIILPDPDAGYTYNKPGRYVVEVGYGTSWPETGDYKYREIHLEFTMTGNEGTMGYMCRTYGQRVANRTDLKFEPMPVEKLAKTQADKDRLAHAAMEEYFAAVHK